MGFENGHYYPKIVNDLITNDPESVLGADQGVVIRERLDSIENASDLLGSIAHNATAPTPGKSGYYLFLDSGVCSWLGGVTVEVDSKAVIIFNSGSYSYSYIALNGSYAKFDDLIYVKSLSRKIFATDSLTVTDATKYGKMKIVSAAFRELYLGVAYQDLICSISRGGDSNTWYVRFYTYSGVTYYARTSTFSVQADAEGAFGLNLLPISLVSDNSVIGYLLIDWNSITLNSVVNGMTSSEFILNKMCFDLNYCPLIKEAKYSIVNDLTTGGVDKKLSAEMGKTLSITDNFMSTFMQSNGFELFKVPAINNNSSTEAAIITRKNLLTSAIRELFINTPFAEGYKIAVGRNVAAEGNSWYFRVYNTSTQLVLEYLTTVNPITSGIQKHILTPKNSGIGTIGDSYVMIDWSYLVDGTAYGSNVSATYYLHPKCFNTAGALTPTDIATKIAASDIDSVTPKYRYPYQVALANVSDSVLKPKMTTVSSIVVDMWLDSSVVAVQNLKISSLSRGHATAGWSIAIYNEAITTKIVKYDNLTNPEYGNGINLIPLYLNSNNALCGYMLIDWTKMTTGQQLGGQAYATGGTVSSDAAMSSAMWTKSGVMATTINAYYDHTRIDSNALAIALLQNKELMKAYMISNFNNNFMFEKLTASWLTPKLIELSRNFNVPTVGAYISTDQENFAVLGATPTVEELQRAYAPHLYIDGLKYGTFVLFDESGAAFIFDKTGTKKLINLT